jgi:tetratricopeptide (TPR) repeat protein
MRNFGMDIDALLSEVERLRGASELEKAVNLASTILEVDATCHYAVRARALLFFDLGRYPDALRDMADLVALCPNSPAPFFERAAFNLELGNYMHVVDDAKIVIEFNDPFFLKTAYLYLAVAHLNLGSKMDALAACRNLPIGFGTYVKTASNNGAFVRREELLRMIEA